MSSNVVLVRLLITYLGNNLFRLKFLARLVQNCLGLPSTFPRKNFFCLTIQRVVFWFPARWIETNCPEKLVTYHLVSEEKLLENYFSGKQSVFVRFGAHIRVLCYKFAIDCFTPSVSRFRCINYYWPFLLHLTYLKRALRASLRRCSNRPVISVIMDHSFEKSELLTGVL